MKSIVSTVIVFGIVIIVIIGGAYLFQSLDGVDTINGLDDKIVADIGKVIEKNDNVSKENPLAEDNVSFLGNASSADNASENLVEQVASFADNASLTTSEKNDNIAVKEPKEVNVTESISNLFKGTKIEEIVKNIAGKIKIFFMAAGLSSGNTGGLDAIRGFLPENAVALDNETMDSILNNPALKKLFEGEGLTLDRENVEKILNDKNIRDYLTTGDLSFQDNASADTLLDNSTLPEAVLGGAGSAK